MSIITQGRQQGKTKRYIEYLETKIKDLDERNEYHTEYNDRLIKENKEHEKENERLKQQVRVLEKDLNKRVDELIKRNDEWIELDKKNKEQAELIKTKDLNIRLLENNYKREYIDKINELQKEIESAEHYCIKEEKIKNKIKDKHEKATKHVQQKALKIKELENTILLMDENAKQQKKALLNQTYGKKEIEQSPLPQQTEMLLDFEKENRTLKADLYTAEVRLRESEAKKDAFRAIIEAVIGSPKHYLDVYTQGKDDGHREAEEHYEDSIDY